MKLRFRDFCAVQMEMSVLCSSWTWSTKGKLELGKNLWCDFILSYTDPGVQPINIIHKALLIFCLWSLYKSPVINCLQYPLSVFKNASLWIHKGTQVGMYQDLTCESFVFHQLEVLRTGSSSLLGFKTSLLTAPVTRSTCSTVLLYRQQRSTCNIIHP